MLGATARTPSERRARRFVKPWCGRSCYAALAGRRLGPADAFRPRTDRPRQAAPFSIRADRTQTTCGDLCASSRGAPSAPDRTVRQPNPGSAAPARPHTLPHRRRAARGGRLQPPRDASQPGIERALAQQSEHRVAIRRRHAQPAPKFRKHAQNRPDLERTPGLQVLQHRRPERAQLARHRDPLGAAHPRRQAEPRADRVGLLHHPQRERVRMRIVEQAVRRRSRQRAERIHVHVAPELRPDVGADVGRTLDVEAARRERVGNALARLAQRGARRADDQPVAAAAHDDARFARRRRQVHHAADRARGRQRGSRHAARIDRVERRAVERAAEAVEKPPRQPVHRDDDDRARPDERRDARSKRRQRVRLQRDDDIILFAERVRVVARAQRDRRFAARLADDSQPAPAQRIERRAARKRAHVPARAREPRRKQPADRADPDDRRAHRCSIHMRFSSFDEAASIEPNSCMHNHPAARTARQPSMSRAAPAPSAARSSSPSTPPIWLLSCIPSLRYAQRK
ncbi:SRM102 [Burkholderia pseudomallei 1710b]|uniref:SRM102 n=1 Tax=Burkholderia pseudomallei (strain 1710b) TaxID=320372 RepID=Q3JRC4_BURP1|nr:SRM102 [Burkholderia pseudomallei 1710b]